MIRLLIIVALVWVAWKLLKNSLLSNAQSRGNAAAGNAATRMVKCQQCGVHLPENEATSKNGHFFCSQLHLEAWQDKDNND